MFKLFIGLFQKIPRPTSTQSQQGEILCEICLISKPQSVSIYITYITFFYLNISFWYFHSFFLYIYLWGLQQNNNVATS